jgi:two-component system, OmpR family, sensor histidine kinase ArlS
LDLDFTAMKKRFKVVMNIKIRLAFQFMLVVAGILIFFAVLVYYFTYTTNREKFRSNLLNRAKYISIIIINRHAVDTALLQNINQSTFSNQNQEIMVTDTNSRVIYSFNAVTLKEKEDVLHSTVNTKNKDDYTFYTIDDKDGVYYKFHYRKKAAYIFVLAFDQARADYIIELRKILFWSILFSLWLSVLTSYLISRKAFKPVTNIINNVKAINSSSLSKRLDEGNRKDELESLAMTFNEMLADLEVAFKNQEDFVSNASHELRTPLSVMIAESDYFLGKEHNVEEYKSHILHMISDNKQINAQLNSLLNLAQVNKDKSIQFTAIRLDEIIYEAVHQVKSKYPDRRIITKIQFPENENDLIISGNVGILVIGVKNIIENACKFSDDDVNVELLIEDDNIKVIISDTGIGIPPKEIDTIYRPFVRASNAKFKSGFGIGLSLVVKIFEIHKADLQVESVQNVGTRFILLFNRLT